MKRVLLVVLAAVAFSFMNVHAQVVFSSADNSNETWYFIQFVRSSKVIQDVAVGETPTQAIAKKNKTSQYWKFVGTSESCKVVSKAGNELLCSPFNDDDDDLWEIYTATQGEGSEMYFEQTYDDENWVLGFKEYENYADEWEGHGGFINDYGSYIGIYSAYPPDDSGWYDIGNDLLFINVDDLEESESPVVFSDESDETWYYIQFVRSAADNLVIQDDGMREPLIQVEREVENAAQHWKFVGELGAFTIESKDGNRFYYSEDDEKVIAMGTLESTYEFLGSPENGWQIADIGIATGARFLNDEQRATVTMYYSGDAGNYLDFIPVDGGVSIATLPVTSVKVYPKPAKDFVYADVPEGTNAISIANALGQTVAKVKPTAKVETINISNLSSGIYFLKFETGTVVKTAKLLVK
jgi:hypothetical protein